MMFRSRPASGLRARSTTRFTTITTSALRLEPCGDGTVDHLPEDAKVPPSLARTSIRLPDRPGAKLVVGRERPDSDAVLPLGTVSGRHALFEMDEDGRLFVTDLGSSNGTDVDGRPLEPDVPFELDVGDVVTLGDPHLARFRLAESRDALGDALSTIRGGAAEAEKAARAVGDAYNAGASAAKKVGDVFAGFGIGDGKGNGNGNGNGSRDSRKRAPADANAREEREEEVVVAEVVDADSVVADSVVADSDSEPVADSAIVASAEPDSTISSSSTPTPNTPNTPNSPNNPNNPDSISSSSFLSEERVMLTPVGWSGPAVELEPGSPVTLGSGRRRGDASVILTAPGVDSSHATVLRAGGAVYIEDLGSAAGTFVGGRQIKPGLQYALTPGADVRLGDGGCRFTVTRVDGDDYEAEPFFSSDASALATVNGTHPDGSRPEMDIVEGADVTLNAVNDGERPAASPWGVIGGLKGMGENLGAAIFNSKINVNYQYKPTYSVGGASGGPAGLSDLKSALLLALADTERGLRADKERRRKIEQLARALEAKNPTRAPLKSPLMNGRWALQYTTALEVLGKNRPGFLRPKGAIWQTVDIFTLQVKNEESFEPLPFVKFKNATTSDLDAQTESRAGVRPKDWRVAGVKFDAPPDSPSRMARNMEMKASGAGSLAWMDTTFVDGEMRISRSQSGDLFILVRDDPNDD
jgi:pSer/pThr/pTyr-binding forkhead associated (FHA) protein